MMRSVWIVHKYYSENLVIIAPNQLVYLGPTDCSLPTIISHSVVSIRLIHLVGPFQVTFVKDFGCPSEPLDGYNNA